MRNLETYVERINAFSAIFGQRALDINNAADRQRIADKIDSDLSPENLTCDGELSAAQVRSRYKLLTAAARELKALDPNVTFYEVA